MPSGPDILWGVPTHPVQGDRGGVCLRGCSLRGRGKLDNDPLCRLPVSYDLLRSDRLSFDSRFEGRIF